MGCNDCKCKKNIKDDESDESDKSNCTEMPLGRFILFMALFAYGFLLALMLATGLDDANSPLSSGKCDLPLVKYEILFPAYRLGCYLGTPLNSDSTKN